MALVDVTKRLKTLWWIAVVTGVIGFSGALLWVNSTTGPGFDWIWVVAAFGAAAIVYNVAFFALCSMFAPGLATLVEDDTEIDGDNVTHVVRHAATGDEALDAYVKTYAVARGTSAVAIVSGIMITVALTFF